MSRELESARQLVANTLQFLGYQPIWQDIFGTEQGDLREMLRRQIDDCGGVMQIVGQHYGSEPPAPDEQFGRVSYTQYEALYARQRGKKVWHLILDENFPADPQGLETDELRALQGAYRQRLQSEAQLYHPLDSRDALESHVLKLRNDLASLRRGVKRWALAVTALLVLTLCVGAWVVFRQLRSEDVAVQTRTDIREQRALLEQVLRRDQARVDSEELTPKQRFDLAVEDIAHEQNRPVEQLRAEIDLFITTVQSDPKADVLDKARAALAQQQFDDAGNLAHAVRQQATQEYEAAKRVSSQMAEKAKNAQLRAAEAYVLEGQAHQNAIRYPEALVAYEAAVSLTEEGAGDYGSYVWGMGLLGVADVHYCQGRYAQAESEYAPLVSGWTALFGAEHPDTLNIRSRRASSLTGQGKYADGEEEYRAVLEVRERLLGAEHPDTLSSRSNLAGALCDQGKYAEAEKEHRVVLAIRERMLGAEHPDTLSSRSIVAGVMYAQCKYAEAENEYREVLGVRQRVLGAEHASTLAVKEALADVLGKLKRWHEAAATQESFLSALKDQGTVSQEKLAGGYLNLSWYQLLAKDYAAVLVSTESGLKIDQTSLSLDTNRAHALMFLERTSEAEDLYLRHKGQKIGDKTWEQIIVEDFDVLEREGLIHPQMARVRNLLSPARE